MGIDYTPIRGDYKDLGAFRFWCQKILPMVYDDSLSYYETLGKLTNYLNDVISNLNTMGVDVTNLHQAYVMLQGWVNHYFDNLDVQNEVNNKLNTMASDGSLTALVQPLFNEYKEGVDNAIVIQNQNIDSILSDMRVLNARMSTLVGLPEGSTSGDGELADARVDANGGVYTCAGDLVRHIDRTVHGVKKNYLYGDFCKGYSSVGDTVWVDDQRFELIIVSVKGGDVVEIQTSENGNAYLYFLKNYAEPVAGETIPFTDTTRVAYTYVDDDEPHSLKTTSRCHLAANVTATFVIPEDVTCLLVSKKDYATDMQPKYISVNGSRYNVTATGLVDDVANNKELAMSAALNLTNYKNVTNITLTKHEKRINNIESSLSNSNDRVVIYVDNPYISAYLKNTHYSEKEWNETSGHPYFTREDVSLYASFVSGGKDKATPFVIEVPTYIGALGYKLVVSENPSYNGAKEIEAVVGLNKITWLKINQTYWIKAVAITEAGETVIQEQVVETKGERRINPVTSVQNMRDLGGQKTANGKTLKQGMLYRCANLGDITAEDARLLEDVLDIRLVVGLANDVEDADLFSDKVETYHPINLGNYGNINVVEARQNVITYLRKIIEYLKQGKAVLYHCNAGADRTGLMSAMIEGLCGVSENNICKDYELTSFSVYSESEGTMTSRTRLGEKLEDGGYRQLGFDNTIWYVRQHSGETYADKWKRILQKDDLAVDGFQPLTDEEVQDLRDALVIDN